MEALIASTILASGVVTVCWAVIAGQQNSVEAKNLISASLAGEELLGEITTTNYAVLEVEAGIREVGFFQAFVTVTTSLEDLPGTGVRVRGKLVTVQVWTGDWSRALTQISHFVPEPLL